jgi:phosphomannomutase
VTDLTCFKAYDIRGRLGVELNEGVAALVGRAFAQARGARRVVLGRDPRASSRSLAAAVAAGLRMAGAEVLDLGLCGTEEMYFAVDHLDADGGIEVTASHNPMDYNGMKLVGAGAAPIADLGPIRALAEGGVFAPGIMGGVRDVSATRAAYVERVLSFVEISALRPLRVLVNAGNGAAGPTFDAIADALAVRGAPFDFVRMHHEPDLSLRANMSWVCWRRCFWPKSRGPRSSTTHA